MGRMDVEDSNLFHLSFKTSLQQYNLLMAYGALLIKVNGFLFKKRDGQDLTEIYIGVFKRAAPSASLTDLTCVPCEACKPCETVSASTTR